MGNRIIGYARVSTTDQNMARQLEALGAVDKLFTDEMSGKNTRRRGLQEMLSFVRAGDIIRTKSIDRLARSTRDLLAMLDELSDRGVSVEFLDTPHLNTNSKEGRFFITVLGALAELERTTIRERQAEGIAIAKAEGKYRQEPKLSRDDVMLARMLIEEGASKASVARGLGVARITLYSALNGKGVYGEYYENDNAIETIST